MRVTVEGPKTLLEMVSVEDVKRKYHSHSVEIREILSKDTNTVRKIWEQSTVDIPTSLRFRPLQINKPVHNSDCLCRWCVRSSVCWRKRHTNKILTTDLVISWTQQTVIVICDTLCYQVQKRQGLIQDNGLRRMGASVNYPVTASLYTHDRVSLKAELKAHCNANSSSELVWENVDWQTSSLISWFCELQQRCDGNTKDKVTFIEGHQHPISLRISKYLLFLEQRKQLLFKSVHL